MRQADLQLGAEYAFPTYEPYVGALQAARVRLLSLGGGKAMIQVLDPGPRLPAHATTTRRVRRNEKLEVGTRAIACPWGEWSDRAAAVVAEREMQSAKRARSYENYEQRQKDRTVVDANRPLPEKYDEDYYSERDAAERESLISMYVRARGLGSYAKAEAIRPLLVDLPVPVLRDVLATDQHRRPGTVGTVAATYLRAAELLETARVGAMRRLGSRDIQHPDELLNETDIAFVETVRSKIAGTGGELILPPVPPLPEWVDPRLRKIAPVFGWLRVAVADTTGQKLHAPGCRSVRSGTVLDCDHEPWWSLMLEGDYRVCNACGGPGVRDLVAVAGFTAAVDVWHARGRAYVEDWQQEALQRLITTTASSRIQTLEPDITLGSRVVAALVENPPGEEGWHAYALGAAEWWHEPARTFKELPDEDKIAAQALLRDRLSILEAVLPDSQPLPATASVEALRERYGSRKRLLRGQVRQLDRLLFTLPNAVSGF